MKVPVGIDLRSASFTLGQFGKRRASCALCQFRTKGLGEKVDLGPGAGRSVGPVTPSQIIARVSVAHADCDWDRAAIFS